MKRIMSLLLLMSALFPLRAETILTGRVSASDGKPLSSAMVKVEGEGFAGKFARTDRDGRYELKLEYGGRKLNVSVSKIGYETEKRSIDNRSQTLDIELLRSSVKLKEVTVKAPSVRLRSDTVSYRLSAFAGKDDVTLKDALKKVPGIDVETNGAIKYNGKSISNFYIEGLDLLGGRYNIATNGLPASYVSAVEILNNHQDIKIDRKIFNDNVAINIRLKPKAKFSPTGTYEAKAGVGRRFLWEASGAGMLFKEKKQSIVTLKGSDIEEFSERDFTRHYSFDNGGSVSDVSDRILGSIGASSAPLSRSRWLSPTDLSASANFITRTSKDATFRANAGYSFLSHSYGYSGCRSYFDGVSDMVVSQEAASSGKRHNPTLSLEYCVNSERLYLVEEFSGKALITDKSVPVTSETNKISQNRNLDNYDLRNYLNIGWKRGKFRWNASSVIEYMTTPGARMSVSRSGEENGTLMQTARSSTFMTSESLSAALDIGRSRISLPLSFRLRHDGIRTSLSGFEEFNGSTNRLKGTNIRIGISPAYYFATPYDRLVLNLSFPFTMQILDYNNTGSSPISDKTSHWLIRPSMSVNYAVSSRSAIKVNASYSETVGDLFDFLTAPVMKDYMSVNFRSGILSRQKVFSSGIRYDLKLPVSFWFANASVNYSLRHNNLLSRQNVGDGIISSSDFLSPNTSDAVTASAGITKNILPVKTKISLTGTWSWSRNRIEQNDIPVKYYGEILSISPRLSSNPFSWLELSYEASVSKTISRYLGRSQSYSMQDHEIGLKLFPVDGLTIKANAEISRREISDSNFKTISLFDLGAVYRLKKFRFGVEMRNILDCRSYSYTIFSALDRFTYDYSLRGRELIVSFSFTR